MDADLLAGVGARGSSSPPTNDRKAVRTEATAARQSCRHSQQLHDTYLLSQVTFCRLMELTGALPPMAGRGAAELGTGSAGGGLVGSSGSGSGGVSSLNPGHNAQYLDKLQVGTR